jgi:hypothetical protein
MNTFICINLPLESLNFIKIDVNVFLVVCFVVNLSILLFSKEFSL